jgi:hypothetical protein
MLKKKFENLIENPLLNAGQETKNIQTPVARSVFTKKSDFISFIFSEFKS